MREFIKTSVVITFITTVITLNLSWYDNEHAYEWIMVFGFLLIVLYVSWDILIHQR